MTERSAYERQTTLDQGACADVVRELISDQGEIVLSIAWSVNSMAGSGANCICRWNELYWVMLDDSGCGGPFESLEEALWPNGDAAWDDRNTWSVSGTTSEVSCSERSVAELERMLPGWYGDDGDVTNTGGKIHLFPVNGEWCVLWPDRGWTTAASHAMGETYAKHFESKPAEVSPDKSVIAPAVIEAYRTAEFRVLADSPFVLKVGEHSPKLAELYASQECESAAFLTPHNPYGILATEAENSARQEKLLRDLAVLGVTAIPGVGADPSGKWPGEESVLALGLMESDAIILGWLYGQNAIVWMDEDAVPDLRLLR